MLYAQTSWVLRNTSFAVICCSLGCWGGALGALKGDAVFPYAWNAGFSTLAALVAWRAHYLRTRRDDVRHARQLAMEQVLMLAGLGLACAGYVHWLFGAGDETLLMVNLLVLGSCIAGCLGFSATYLPVFLAFALPITLTVWVDALAHFGRSVLVDSVALTLPVYLLAMVYFALQFQRSGVELIRSRFERERLNQDLQHQMAQTDAARLRAEAAEQAQTRFLATTSHDLRQPLQAMALFMQALDRTGMTPAQTLVVDKLDLSVRALTIMLNGLLDFSRIRTGVKYNLQPMPLQPTLFDLSVEFGGAADGKQLVLRLRDTCLWVRMDPLALQLILRNLLSNAIRYTHHGGVLLGARQRGDDVMVEVWDTGQGIAPEHLRTVFDAYYQVDNPERNIDKGLGLGLSIVRDVVEQIGGRLEVKSRLGRGSVFRCYLPRVQESMQFGGRVFPADVLARSTTPALPTMPGRPGLPHDLPKMHVLVVDDHTSVLQAVCTLLQSLGCVCHGATDLAQAREILRAQPVHALLTDYRLAHGETGVDVIQSLQALRPGLGAVLFTGDMDLRNSLQALLPQVPVLIKPISAVELVQALNSVRC